MQSAPPPPTDHFVRRHAAKIVASLVIAGGFAWMMRQGGLPLVPTAEAFVGVRWWTLPAYSLLVLVSFAFRTYRWVYLLRPIANVSTRRVVGIGLIGAAAILLAPLRMGEVVRPYMIAVRGKLSFAQAAGTIGAERVIDGLVLSLFLFAGLAISTPLSPLPDHLGKLPLPVAAVPASAYAALALFACAFVAMAVFYARRDFARRVTHAIVDPISSKLARWLTDKVEKVTDGLRFLPDTKHSGPFLRDTILYWIATLASMWLLLWGCGIKASFAEASVVMGVLGVGILIPAGPGFFGAFQISTYSALAMFFDEQTVLGPGSAYVFLIYLIQLALSLVVAAMGFAIAGPGDHPGATPSTTPANDPG